MNPIQLTNVEQVAGKTIKLICEQSQAISFRFTDDTFIKIIVYPDYDGYSLNVSDEYNNYDLLNLEFIDQIELEKRIKETSEKQRQEYVRSRKELYESLKKEFNGE